MWYLLRGYYALVSYFSVVASSCPPRAPNASSVSAVFTADYAHIGRSLPGECLLAPYVKSMNIHECGGFSHSLAG